MYHVIVLKASSALIKSCDCKCKIFSRSVRQTSTPFRVPSKIQPNIFNPNKENCLKQIKANCNIGLETKTSRRHTSLKRENFVRRLHDRKKNIPSIPILCPKYWLGLRIWFKTITIVSIACIKLKKRRLIDVKRNTSYRELKHMCSIFSY